MAVRLFPRIAFFFFNSEWRKLFRVDESVPPKIVPYSISLARKSEAGRTLYVQDTFRHLPVSISRKNLKINIYNNNISYGILCVSRNFVTYVTKKSLGSLQEYNGFGLLTCESRSL